jgi:hypothetical protein
MDVKKESNVKYVKNIETARVVEGGDALQIRRVATNMFNKLSRIDDKGWSSDMLIGRGPKKQQHMKMI